MVTTGRASILHAFTPFPFPRLQISGVSLPSYWLSTFAWDIANYLVPYAIFLVLIWSFGITDLTTGNAGFATAMLLLFYGCVHG